MLSRQSFVSAKRTRMLLSSTPLSSMRPLTRCTCRRWPRALAGSLTHWDRQPCRGRDRPSTPDSTNPYAVRGTPLHLAAHVLDLRKMRHSVHAGSANSGAVERVWRSPESQDQQISIAGAHTLTSLLLRASSRWVSRCSRSICDC
jgi:hypothetical protein